MLQITEEGRRLIRAALGIHERARKAPVTLPHVTIQKRRKLNRDRHNRILRNVVAMMRTGTFSKFEFEGSCQNGIRAALCLESWPWREADKAASEIVAAALKQIGAVRPAWGEGQPDYTGYSEFDRQLCAHCGRLIMEDRLSKYAGGRTRYCSATCGTYARRDRQGADYEKMSLVEFLAQQAVRSQRTLEKHSRDCEQCGTHFLTKTPGRKYCSRRCYSAAYSRQEVKTCPTCGEHFEGKRNRQFCSSACSGIARASSRVEKSCKACSALFMVRPSELTRAYCSQSCNPRGPRAVRPGFQCEAV